VQSFNYVFEIVEITEEAILLQQKNIEAGIFSSKSTTDALHVALASVSNCNIIINWNFKHIVNF